MLKKYFILIIGSALSIISPAAGCGLNWLNESPATTSRQFNYKVSIIRQPDCILDDLSLYMQFNPNQLSEFNEGGWSIPLISSKAIPLNDDVLHVFLPDGTTIKLSKSKDFYTGDGWIARANGNLIELKSSCGWSLLYKKGKIIEMKSPSNDTIEFLRNNSVVSIKKKGTSDAITITRQSNEFGYEIKSKSKLIEIKYTPSIMCKYYDVAVTNGDKTTESLSIKIKKEKNCSLNSLNGKSYEWDADNGLLLRTPDAKVSTVVIEGIQCTMFDYFTSESELFGQSNNALTQIHRPRGSNFTNIYEYLKSSGGTRLLQNFKSVDRDKKELSTCRFSYDENYNLIKTVTHNSLHKITTLNTLNEQKATSDDSGIVLWKKTFDYDGRIKNYQEGPFKYIFTYPEEGLVTIEKFEGEKLISTKSTGSPVVEYLKNSVKRN